jgi:hypothetical protein
MPPVRSDDTQEAAVNLDPDRFVCPVHQVDLTQLVRVRLREDEDAEMAFGGFSGWGNRAERSAEKPRQFQVVVSCPGGGTPHRHVCEGAYTP